MKGENPRLQVRWNTSGLCELASNSNKNPRRLKESSTTRSQERRHPPKSPTRRRVSNAVSHRIADPRQPQVYGDETAPSRTSPVSLRHHQRAFSQGLKNL